MFFNKITIVILFTFWLKAIFSQNVFNINIPGANYRNFIITKDSGFITYQAEPPIYNGGTIYKINKYGNILDSIFNPKVETASKNKILNSKDGFVLAGETYTDHIDDGWGIDLIFEKLDFTGTIIWQLPLEGVFFIDAINTSDGNFLMLAQTLEQAELGMTDIVLYKINEDGLLLWKKIIGNQFVGEFDDSYFEFASSITEIDQNYYLSYGNYYKDLSKDSKLTKIDSEGHILWTLFDEFNSKKLRTITATFKLNDNFYFVNNDSNKVFEINDANGEYIFTNKNIRVQNTGYSTLNYNINCNELVLIENNTFYKYNSIDTPSNFAKMPDNLIRDIVKTFDGGYAILYIDGRFIKTDCFGNTDFWDESCTPKLKQENKIIVYPNPTQQDLTIETNFDIRKTIVINYVGKEVVFENFCGCKKQTIDVSTMSQATYFIKVIGVTGFELSRFIKY